MPPYVNVHYNAPTHNVRPALDTMRKRGLKDRKRGGMETLDGDLSDKWQARQAVERREQYRQVSFLALRLFIASIQKLAVKGRDKFKMYLR